GGLASVTGRRWPAKGREIFFGLVPRAALMMFASAFAKALARQGSRAIHISPRWGFSGVSQMLARPGRQRLCRRRGPCEKGGRLRHRQNEAATGKRCNC